MSTECRVMSCSFTSADPTMTAEKSKQAVALAKRALGLDLDVHFSFTSLDVVLTAVLEKLAMQDEMLAELTDGARPARSDSASPLPATGGGGGGRIYALYDDLKGEVDELRTRLDASESKNSLLESKLDEALHTADALESLSVDTERMRANLDASGGTLLAESVAMALAESLGTREAHACVAAACRHAASERRPLADVLNDDPVVTRHLDRAEIARRLSPDHYLGVAHAFIERVLSRLGETKGDDV